MVSFWALVQTDCTDSHTRFSLKSPSFPSWACSCSAAWAQPCATSPYVRRQIKGWPDRDTCLLSQAPRAAELRSRGQLPPPSLPDRETRPQPGRSQHSTIKPQNNLSCIHNVVLGTRVYRPSPLTACLPEECLSGTARLQRERTRRSPGPALCDGRCWQGMCSVFSLLD